MQHSSRILLGLMFVVSAIAASKAKTSGLKEVNHDKYKPGQVWSYKTRTDEPASTLTILRVDEYAEKKHIVHVRVDHIVLKNCTGGPEPEAFEHMPFAKEALDQSVVKMLHTGPVPDFHNGYSEWRAGWDARKAGFYTVTVAQALDVAQSTFNQGLGCSK